MVKMVDKQTKTFMFILLKFLKGKKNLGNNLFGNKCRKGYSYY